MSLSRYYQGRPTPSLANAPTSSSAGHTIDYKENIQAAEYSEDVLRANKIKDDVSTYIQDKPEDAAKLLKVWLTDGGE